MFHDVDLLLVGSLDRLRNRLAAIFLAYPMETAVIGDTTLTGVPYLLRDVLGLIADHNLDVVKTLQYMQDKGWLVMLPDGFIRAERSCVMVLHPVKVG